MAQAIKLNSGDAPSFIVTQTLEKNLLNYANIEGNSNKYYQIELQKGSGKYPYRIYTEYGRVGRTKVQEGRYYHSRLEAENDFYKIRDQKENKGYVVLTMAEDDTTKIKSKLDLSVINNKVLQLIGKFYHEAMGFVTTSVKTPLGQISASQIMKGIDILNQIEDLLGRSSNHEYQYLSDQFYSYIPVIFEGDRSKMIIDSYKKVLDKREMLGVMSSVVIAQDELQSSIEDKYKSLNLDIQLASPEDAKRITKHITKTQSSKHHFKLKVSDVFEVKNMTDYDNFNPYKVSTMELFHGSRNCNMLGIMQSGLKVKPSTAVHTGSMFGAGIYFANQSSKSANYCWGFGHSQQSFDTNFLLICEVATGKIKEYTDAQYHLTAAPRGYNSVMGKAGSSLLHDEYIVYNANQTRIKYIAEIKIA